MLFLRIFLLSGWDGWTEHRLPQMYSYFYHYYSKDSCWSSPPDYNPSIGHLTRDEIQVWCNYFFSMEDRLQMLLFRISVLQNRCNERKWNDSYANVTVPSFAELQGSQINQRSLITTKDILLKCNWVQMNRNICKLCRNHCESLKIIANHLKSLQITWNHGQSLEIIANH